MKCLIIDDEKRNQEQIKRYVGRCSDLELMGICSTIKEARSIMNQEAIDLLFLDVELSKGENGLEFYKTLKYKPYVIVVTSHAKYALSSYAEHIEGFLQKPFRFEQFRSALNHILALDGRNKRVKNIEHIEHATGKFIPIFNDDNELLLSIPFTEIAYIEQLNKDICIYTIDKRKYIRKRLYLSEFENMLPFLMFQRITKSVIINKMYASIVLDSVEILGRIFRISEAYRLDRKK